MLFQEGQKFDVGSDQCLKQKGIIQNKRVVFYFQDLKPGKYAIMVFHDENEDGELKTNFIGMPKEGVGTSNNHQGIPSFRKCQFEIKGNKELGISMVYL